MGIQLCVPYFAAKTLEDEWGAGTWSTYCCASENGSITAKLLVGILAHMDKTGIFA